MTCYSTTLSGLQTQSSYLNSIANNLTNSSTTGYKTTSTDFATAFYQLLGTSGSGDSIQVGTGVKTAQTSTDYTTGTLATSSSSADMAINGSGFFILDDNGKEVLTRSGDFTVSSTGALESSDGYGVMGYAADSSGTISTTGTLTDLTLPVGKTMAAKATSTFSLTENLSSSTAVGSTTSATETVYDSQGTKHTLNITYTKTGTNSWSYNMSMDDTLTASKSTTSGATSYSYAFGSSNGTTDPVSTSTDLTITGLDSSGNSVTITAPTITDGETLDTYVSDLNTAISAAGITGVTATNNNGTLVISAASSSDTLSVSGDVVAALPVSSSGSGTLSFDSNGNLNSSESSITGITVSGLSDGASDLNLTWDLTDSSGTSLLTQTSSSSSTSANTQDGYASGTYEGFSVSSDGVITATYSNDQTQTVGQIALGDVTNEQGLTKLSSTNYQITTASGSLTVGTADSGTYGSIEDNYLESSNVSISTEFADLIIAQRAYEANSKALTTQDTLIGDTINIVK